jgi:hypothetical protein
VGISVTTYNASFILAPSLVKVVTFGELTRHISEVDVTMGDISTCIKIVVALTIESCVGVNRCRSSLVRGFKFYTSSFASLTSSIITISSF